MVFGAMALPLFEPITFKRAAHNWSYGVNTATLIREKTTRYSGFLRHVFAIVKACRKPRARINAQNNTTRPARRTISGGGGGGQHEAHDQVIHSKPNANPFLNAKVTFDFPLLHA